jgi:hypothetical protein
MNIDDILHVLFTIIVVLSMFSIVPLVLFVLFPFFQSFTYEKRIEKLIDEECLKGNEIAIRIRRREISYFADRDHLLIKEAINGNENAVRALKLDCTDPYRKL